MAIQRSNFAQEIQSTFNGEDAIDFLEKQYMIAPKPVPPCPELNMLDISMPVMDGFDFLTELRQRAHLLTAAHIVILTSSSNPCDLETASNLGVSGYVNKPLTVEKLEDLRLQLL